MPRRRERQAKPQHKNIDRHRPSPTPATFSLAANDSAKCILYGFSQGRFPKRSISPRRNNRLASPPQTSKSFRTDSCTAARSPTLHKQPCTMWVQCPKCRAVALGGMLRCAATSMRRSVLRSSYNGTGYRQHGTRPCSLGCTFCLCAALKSKLASTKCPRGGMLSARPRPLAGLCVLEWRTWGHPTHCAV